MAEPRARITHQKGQQNFSKELKILMYAYGDTSPPLDSTLSILDEIVTDFIIETCHEASRYASHARRAKIKVDDFRFVLRHDAAKLGRVQELLAMDKVLKTWRKVFNENDDRLDRNAAAAAAAAAAMGGRRRRRSSSSTGGREAGGLFTLAGEDEREQEQDDGEEVVMDDDLQGYARRETRLEGQVQAEGEGEADPEEEG